jgi:Domain of unknown function (DUF4198)
MVRARGLGVLFVMGVAAAALAHDTWIAPRAFVAKAGDTMTFDATSHQAFPVLDFAIVPERIARSGVRLAGHTRPLAVRRRGAKSLELQAGLPTAGIAVAWIELAPKQLELTPDKVAEYLEDIGRGADAKNPPKGRWRESYRKLMKTFVAVGETSNDDSASEPLGLALELVPLANPCALRVGDALRLRLLKDGRPRGGLAVAAAHASSRRRFETTNAEGEVSFVVDGPGPWLFAATQLDRSTKPGLEWESLFATLTLGVEPAPPKALPAP